METLVMSGRPVADAYKEQIKEKVEAAQKSGKKVTLAILTVGQDPASFVYRKRLLKITESLGIGSRCVELPETATTEETVAAIRKLNEDPDVTGILPMMPMPKQVDGDAVGAALAPEKDMDCLNPANGGALLMGKGRWAACTPRACMAMLKFYKIPLDGKHAVVLGRSNVVGKPVALLLLQENCTVTVCHSHTKNLPELVRQADIVVAAICYAGYGEARRGDRGCGNQRDGKRDRRGRGAGSDRKILCLYPGARWCRRGQQRDDDGRGNQEPVR